MIALIFTTILYLIIGYIILTYIYHLITLRNYPPGPFPLPIIGNLHLFENGSLNMEVFARLAKQYGSVFSFSFGMDRLVIVNGIGPIREALITKGNRFAGRRTNNGAIEYITRGFTDIAFSDYGPYWSRARKLAHSALKVYGDGMGKLEGKIMNQFEKLNKRLKSNGKQPVDLGLQLYLTILNIISSKVFNTDYDDINHPEFQQMMEFVKFQNKGFSAVDVWLSGTSLFRYAPLNCYRMLKRCAEIRDGLLEKQLTEHERSLNTYDIRDFTDSLLNASKEESNQDGAHAMSRSHLEMIISDIFIAGFETTATTMKWCVLYLLHWPQYQDLVHDEMIRVLHQGKRYATLNDRSSLPMAQAVVQETLRLSSVAIMTIEHRALENDSIDGQLILNGTGVWFNLMGLHYDEDVWENPKEFNPWRWLDEEGNYSPAKHRSFLPFSTGRRGCLGESIAKAELFILITALLRDFKINPNLDEPFPSLVGNVGFVYYPNDFTVTLSARN